MRNEKDFFKWSFGLRFLFVSLCALMCIGNAWGADYIAKVAFYTSSDDGGVSQLVTNYHSNFCKRSYNNAIEAFDGTTLGTGTSVYVGYAYSGSSTTLDSKCKALTKKTKSSPQNQTFQGSNGKTSIDDDGTYNVKLSDTYYCYAAPLSGKKFTGWTVKKGIGNNEGDAITEKDANAPIYYECETFKMTVNSKEVTFGRLKVTTLKGHSNSHGSSAIPAACQYTIIANFEEDVVPKVDFEVSSYDSKFSTTDYRLVVGGQALAVTSEENGQRTLYEGLEMTFRFDIQTATTRGVQFNGWYYKAGTDGSKTTISLEKEFQLNYATLKSIADANPGKTIIFGVNVEKKATRNITFLVNPNGSYHASFMDANGNGTEHTNTSNSKGTFKVAKDAANDITKSLYEDDKIRLERTNSGDGNDVSSLEDGKLFRCWYWEDANGNRTYLEKGEPNSYAHVDNRLDIVLPEEATRVGADIVTPVVRDITFVSSEHGSYSVKADKYDGTLSTVTPTIAANSSNVVVNNLLMMGAVTLKTPVAATGYAFSRWYYTTSDGIKKTLASQSEDITVLLPEGTATVGAEFVQVGDFSVSGLYFTTLTDAIQAAQSEVSANPSSTSTIIVARDATVPAGNYTIPAKVVLLIPYKAEQYISGPVDRIETTAVPDKDHAYRKLTLANGAHLEVYGTIEVSGCQTTAQQRDVEISRPGGSGASYGLMQMDNGSSITLNDKSQLNAWGFIQGTGTIDARRGSSVREQFQINDWKTLITTCRMAAGGSINYQLHVLPINQYFIQNVEVKTTYHPGARLFGQVSANVIGMKLAFNDVGIIGVKYSDKEKADALEQQHILLEDDVAVFLMDNADNSEDTWVCKWYDVENDQQVYDVNNSAYLGSLAMEINFADNGINIDLSAFGYGDIEGIDVDSRDFALPLTNNFKIHLKSGNLVVTQNTILLPGAVIEIDKKSTMTIVDEVRNKQTGELEQDKPQTLYLYDANQWGRYVTTGVNDGGAFTTIFDAFNNYDLLFGYGSRVKFRPGGVPNVRDISSPAGLGDAQLIVHGTVDVKGYLKTTYGDKNVTYVDNAYTYTPNTTLSQTEGGAITSRVEDAGTIIFSRQAQSLAQTSTNNHNNFLWQVDEAKTDDYVHYVGSHVIPAWLTNDAGSTYSAGDGYTETADAPAGKSFCFIDIDGDNKGEWVSLTNDGCFVYDGTDYYAKPKEYVALANGKTANEDHTYSDKAGQGRLFILVDDCQWWEVEKKDNLYHCINPDNDTYYYWDNSSQDEAKHKWREKEFAITWVNWDGSSINWDGTTEETKYQNHVIYPLHYGITPKYLEDKNPTRPDDVDYTYNFIGWTPEIVPVTGDATYTAKYQAIQKKYTIIFKDQNDEEIERQQLALGETPSAPDISSISNSYWNPAIAVVSGNATYQVATYTETPSTFTVTWANYNGSTISSEQVTKDDKPVYSGSTPVKNLNNEYNYTWTGWQSPAGTYSKTATLPDVTANITYTATFSVEPKKYNINFYDENGNQLGSTQNLAFGADPVVPKYSKAATAQYTYTLKWYESDPEEDAMVNVPTVTRDANYKAYFTETLNKYTLKLQSNNNDVCTFTGAGIYDYGTTGIDVVATIADDYTFDHWDGVDWNTTSGTIAELTGDMTLVLYVQPTAGVSNLEVAPGSEEDITPATQCNDFVLTSNGTQSGQVTGVENIELFGDAYYDLILDNPQSRTWYSVAVPWQVDATSGIWAKNGTSARRLVLGSDFDIIYYNGARRAAGESQAWDYLEEQSSKIMMPGKAYMIAFRSAPQTIRFQKVSRAALLNTQTSVESYPSVDEAKANWNGIANPALYYAYINAGSENGIGYIYRAGRPDSPENRYMSFEMDDNKLIVGQPIYVQAETAKSIVANTTSYNAAPRRRGIAAKETRYKVDITRDGKQNDRIYLQTDDEKEDKYIIGQDLAKMGVSSKVAQMWIDRYNAKLCLNTVAPVDEVATYPLVLSAPQADAYTIEVVAQPDDDNDLYLTLDGQAIWNLSDGAYTANLEKGTTDRYGLRVSAKTPKVVTGVEETSAATKEAAIKMLIDNQVFIIRGEQVYTIDGQLVK